MAERMSSYLLQKSASPHPFRLAVGQQQAKGRSLPKGVPLGCLGLKLQPNLAKG
jgi:hypothetical protein